jgi:signal transduction histidine kinase
VHGSWTSWRSRRIHGVPVIDLTLASLIGAVALASALHHEPPEGPLWLTVPVAIVLSGALVLRRVRPLAMAAVVAVAAVSQAMVSVSPGSLWALAVFLIAMVSVGAHASEGRAAAGGALLLASLFLQEWLDAGSDYLFMVLVFGGAWLIGRGLNGWSRRAIAAESSNTETARLATAEERLRVARELHDVVAHSLGVIAVQSEAADALFERDPQRARVAVQAVQSSARDALDEMRQFLGVLRAEPDGLPLEPTPRLDGLVDLIATFTAAGLRVTLTQTERPATLRPGLDLTAYRIVQESLSNVLRFAGPVAVSVRVATESDHLRVEVSNAASMRVTGVTRGAGLGLLGLRERVEALGGSLSHGPVGGGFRVVATIPLKVEPS